MKNRHKLFNIGIPVLIIGALALLSAKRVLDANQAQAHPASARPPVKVEVVTVRRGMIRQWIAGEGTSRAVRREFLKFENPGKVVSIGKQQDGSPLREGSRVKGPREGEAMGQLIARVDSRDYIQTLNLYEAELDHATGRIAIKEKKDALLVPTGTLLFRNNAAYLFVADPETGTVEKRHVDAPLHVHNFRPAGFNNCLPCPCALPLCSLFPPKGSSETKCAGFIIPFNSRNVGNASLFVTVPTDKKMIVMHTLFNARIKKI